MTRWLRPEGLCHGERRVPEVRLGRDQLDVDALLRKISEREHRLDRRNPPADDHHPLCALHGRHIAHASARLHRGLLRKHPSAT